MKNKLENNQEITMVAFNQYNVNIINAYHGIISNISFPYISVFHVFTYNTEF